MQVIKNIPIEDLRLKCVDLLSKTFLQLRQNPTEDDIVSLAVILAEDLKEDFDKLHWIDIQKAFRQGIRNTDEFVVGVKTWYKWIKAHRQLIWSNEDKEIQYVDKRLQYRFRNNNKTQLIGNIKQLKQ